MDNGFKERELGSLLIYYCREMQSQKMLNEKENNPKNGFSAKAGGITRGSQYTFVTQTCVLFVSCILSDFWCIFISEKQIGSNFHVGSWEQNTGFSDINKYLRITFIYLCA